jgi:phytanoyl-CoA hydroxylase
MQSCFLRIFPKNCLLRFIGYKMTSSLQQFPHRITDTHFTIAELNRFDRDGFIVIRGLADPIQVEKIVQVTDAALLTQTPPVEYEADLGYPGAPTSAQQPGGRTPRRFQQALHRDPSLYDWATSPKVVDRLRQLLNSNPVLSLAHHNSIMVKDPYFSSDTGWHRDIRYWHFANPELITVQLALTPSTLENGCLRFLPGSHKIPVSPHQFDAASFLRTDLPENQGLLDREVSFSLEPGDVIFFHALTFHAAGRNRSSHVRKSLLFTYRSTDNFPIPGTRSAAYPELFLS